jgi:cyclopropane fatty-acyl-phospholipid synthase-like methyltransferase
MSEKNSNSANFYDEFNAESAKSPINDRIIGLYKKILAHGLAPDSVNLELGCGPGKLTYLLSKKIKDGIIEATDISPRSVEIAQSKVKNPNVHFNVCDVLDYKPINPSFDNIFLFDVIEHIPENNHPDLFSRIDKWMTNDSSLLINIPNPNYILFARKYRPESLQEIDQAITLDNLSKSILDAGLEISFFETYSIWSEDDYQFMIIKKQKPYIEKLLSNQRNIFQKASARIIREYRKLRYRY